MALVGVCIFLDVGLFFLSACACVFIYTFCFLKNYIYIFYSPFCWLQRGLGVDAMWEAPRVVLGVPVAVRSIVGVGFCCSPVSIAAAT